MYQVGDIQFLKKDDPKFCDLASATSHAVKLSFEARQKHETAFFGVWDLGNRYDLVAVVYDTEVFTK